MKWTDIDIETVGLHDLLSLWADQRPDSDVLIFEGADIFKDRIEQYSFKEMNRLANQCANMLIGLGVEKGDRVAIYLPNCPEFIMAYFGILKTGAAMVPVSPIFTAREIAYEFTDTRAVAVVTTEALADNIDLAGFDDLQHVIVIDGEEKGLSFYKLLEAAPEADPKIDVDPKTDIAMVPYTSGSTGVPKGVPHTHYAFTWNLREALRHMGMEDKEVVVCTTTPLFHVTGYHDTFGVGLFSGCPTVVLERFDPEKILQLIEKYRATFTLIPTAGLIWLLLVTDKEKYDLSSLEGIMSGGAAVPQDVGEQITRTFGVDLVEGYGSTEVLISHINPRSSDGPIKFGSVGLRLNRSDDICVKIVDETDGKKEVAQGEFGEIIIRSPAVAQGYLGRTEESDDSFRDGFWYSGDIGFEDEDGYLFITDRKKDMISVSGFKCWPREVEEVIHTLPQVSDAAVVGKSDPVKGEVPVAFVALNPGKALSAQEIAAHLKDKLAKYKLPVDYRFVDAIPKTIQGKIQKDALRQILIEQG